MKMLMGLFLLLSFETQANVAVDQIQTMLAKRHNHALEIKKTFEDYYLLYVFKSTCPHCKKFTPLLQDFSKSTGIKLDAYYLDNDTIGTLKSRRMAPKLFDVLFISAGFRPVVPALFLVNKQTFQAYAVSFGETDAVELVSRLDTLMTKIKEKFDA